MENEYAVSAIDARGVRLDQGPLLDALLGRVRARLPYLMDDHGHGIFLQNGARFYVDAGGHPEFTTPECSNPWDVVRYVRAGESTLVTAAAGVFAHAATSLYRCNVDYSGSGSTWGCHESYMHRADLTRLPAQLIPHLVSRVVYSGAGGFDNVSPGVKFTLSPRATHVCTDISNESTSRRGIYHTKDESLCGGDYHRLHITFGESLCSDLAVWLKMGTTALVVALCEAGLRPGDAVALRAPVKAAHLVAGDPTCTAVVATASGPRSAVAIQRHYLGQVEAQLGAAFLPPWAEGVCRRWRDTLDRLDGGWEDVATTLDWAIKLALFRDRVRRRGLAWESLAAWTTVAEKISAALGHTTFANRPLRSRFLCGLLLPIQDEVQRLMPFVRQAGLEWDAFGSFLDLRDELFEIDTRFGQLGHRGLFAGLDDSGMLVHRVEGAGDIARAIETPPDVPRARLRGQLVRQLAGNDERYCCDWEGVWDCEEGKRVDLRDPFGTTANWQDWPGPAHFMGRIQRRRVRADAPVPSPPDPIVLSDRARQLRMRGQLEEAERIFRQAIAIEDARVPPLSPKRPHRRNHLSIVLMVAGKLAEARQVNAEAWRLKAEHHDLVSGRILFVRVALRFLFGERDVSLYLGQLKTLFGWTTLECHANIAPTWEIPDVLEVLCQKLVPAEAALLVHISETLNDRGHLPRLERLAAWTAAAPMPLEALWPGD
jgi:hypothetical protein